MDKEEKKKEVSVKSTKNEILDAYNQLLKQMKEKKMPDRQAEKKTEGEKQIVKNANQLSMEKIIKGLAEIKLEIGSSLEGLEEKLISQYKKLVELEQAIEIETKRLNEVHEITINADSLAALLMAQKEQKEKFETEVEKEKIDFETEMNGKKAQWKKEQETFETARKERETQLKKEKQREEDEYAYNLKMTRKKEKDAYEAQKAAQEKELAEKKSAVEKDLKERDAVITGKEKEYEELKTKVEAFSKELEKAVKDTEKTVIEKLEIKYKHGATLAAKEIEGERKLYKQTIEALENKIKDQEVQIRQLTQKINESGRQVQDIAIKAIESSSHQKVISMNYEKRPQEETSKNQPQ